MPDTPETQSSDAVRKPGRTKLVYDKTRKSVVAVHTDGRSETDAMAIRMYEDFRDLFPELQVNGPAERVKEAEP